MSVGLAPRPANEERRAQAVVKTGLIDAPNPEIFQVYCDLAKDITGFEEAYFSLIDKDAVKAWKRHKTMTLNLVVPLGDF